jgi:hypothetical protein
VTAVTSETPITLERRYRELHDYTLEPSHANVTAAYRWRPSVFSAPEERRISCFEVDNRAALLRYIVVRYNYGGGARFIARSISGIG